MATQHYTIHPHHPFRAVRKPKRPHVERGLMYLKIAPLALIMRAVAVIGVKA